MMYFAPEDEWGVDFFIPNLGDVAILWYFVMELVNIVFMGFGCGR